MKTRTSFHTHTTFSDGENTPRQMIEAALDLGITTIGFTDHSYTFFDESYCIPRDRLDDYAQTILALKAEYQDRIEVKLGIEQDYYSEEPTDAYEYVIGSVHYVRVERSDCKALSKDLEGFCGWKSDPSYLCLTAEHIYIPVDESLPVAADILVNAAADFFDGDIYALTEAYFASVGDVVNRTGADIIGHFDVITKCNTLHPVFDPSHPRYQAAWKKAADRLLAAGKIFEINVSPLLRGIRPEPYPADEIRHYLKERGARFIVTGDCHNTQALQFSSAFPSL